jgi:hypothetical protein
MILPAKRPLTDKVASLMAGVDGMSNCHRDAGNWLEEVKSFLGSTLS